MPAAPCCGPIASSAHLRMSGETRSLNAQPPYFRSTPRRPARVKNACMHRREHVEFVRYSNKKRNEEMGKRAAATVTATVSANGGKYSHDCRPATSNTYPRMSCVIFRCNCPRVPSNQGNEIHGHDRERCRAKFQNRAGLFCGDGTPNIIYACIAL